MVMITMILMQGVDVTVRVGFARVIAYAAI